MVAGEQPEEDDDNADMPGWGHWAMPQQIQAMENDMELHQGEFLALNDLMEPNNDDLHVLALNNAANEDPAMVVGEQPEEDDDNADMPGWGHWAMPQQIQAVENDMELHQGEFLALNDLMEPMDEDNNIINANSSITLSGGPSDNSANSDASANGPLAPNMLQLPDLNMDIEPFGPGPLLQAHQPVDIPPMPEALGNLHPHAVQNQPIIDHSLDIIMHQPMVSNWDTQEDPMQLELLAHAPFMPQITITDKSLDPAVAQPPLMPVQNIKETDSDFLLGLSQIDKIVQIYGKQNITGETDENNLDKMMSADSAMPPTHNTEEDSALKDITAVSKQSEESLIGKEGAKIWKEHLPLLLTTEMLSRATMDRRTPPLLIMQQLKRCLHHPH